MAKIQLKWTGKTITKLSLHRRRSNPFNYGYGLEHVPFLLLYCLVLYYCYQTIGEPYAIALQELKDQGKEIPRHALSSMYYSGSSIKIDGDSNLASAALSGGIVREDSVPQKSEVQEDEEDGPPLPNPFLPGLAPLLCLLSVFLSHILMMLLQVWFVSVLTFIKYRSVYNMKDAQFVRVVPRSFKGKAVLVPLEQHQLKDGTSGEPFFIFQKRKYVAEVVEETEDNLVIVFKKLKSPVNNTLKDYISWKGFTSEHDFNEKMDLYGKNEFHIPQPTFIEMYKEQLLQPLTVFQLFSIFLWVLDEYWQYPLFTLCMILLFEGVTVFSRIKSLSTLRGLGNVSLEMYVYRFNKWEKLSSEMLVPGDLISLSRGNDGENTIPCDCLILQGSAVTNESSLTGESIPQMKESIGCKLNEEDLASSLDMKSSHKVHVLFSGTILMQQDDEDTVHEIDAVQKSSLNNFPKTPNGGCLGYVLRTGFSSSQGKLVRMIEYSSGKTAGDTRDALGLALLLLLFALLSAGYVMHKGIEAKGRMSFELLLRCVLIVTSVVPAELPMQTSLAINSALLTLVKLAIFCTEPYRIALAGKVDICLFDKTGTLTTDQLTAVGITCWDPQAESNKKNDTSVQETVPLIAASIDASLVLAGCHSLVAVDGKVVGDPVEEAAIRAIGFEYDPHKRKCIPGKDTEKNSRRSWNSSIDKSRISVDIIHRNHFASKLQRMSVVARVNSGVGKPKLRSLVKGSPEMIAKLLSSNASANSPWYWNTYKSMARKGMRVLALAYKDFDSDLSEHDVSKMPRSWAESDLQFVGFAAFQCLVRRDSAEIVTKLRESSHDVTMITGDAILTAIHVAREVALTTKDTLLLSEDDDGKLLWISAKDDSFVTNYDSKLLKKLSKEYDLALSGKNLLTISDIDDLIWANLEHIRVFARMTPELKERVLISLKKHGHHTLMCGDGANDVGALKQAHVGVALLSGFGSANADAAGSSSKSKDITGKSKEELLTLHVSVLKKELKRLSIEPKQCREKEDLVNLILKHDSAKMLITKKDIKPKNKPSGMSKEEQAALMKKKQEEIEIDVRARELRGESFARVKAMWAFFKKEASEQQAKRAKGSGFAARATNATLSEYMDDFEDGQLPMVKPGDASIASPFTSRAPSIKATVDIIRQGRCALVTTMQMYQILAINCLISSYSLSVLYLDKVKYGNHQMTALGVISTVASLNLSRATPLDKLSPVRPLTSVFHPALFCSVFGQFFIHLACMIYSTQLAKQYTPENDDTHSKSGKFEPNIMSTIVFLVNAVQTVSVCAVNYKGRPFMKGMADNPGLLYSLGACFIGVFLSATEALPLFNSLLQIVPMPDVRFTLILTLLLALDVFGSFVWDQICVIIFAPHIFYASMNSMAKKDIYKYVKMAAITMVIIYFLSNIDYNEIEKMQKAMDDAQNAAKNASQTA